MTVLVLGPNGSGKSAYAEELAVQLLLARERDDARFPCQGQQEGALYYIATMIPYGDEGFGRVERHRKQRAAMGFHTIEKPYAVSEIQLPPGAAVLLEDASNLLGNALFEGVRGETWEGVYRDIAALNAKCGGLVIVSIDGLAENQGYSSETNKYIRSLDLLNRKLADLADTVALMRGGAPVIVKGAVYAPYSTSAGHHG